MSEKACAFVRDLAVRFPNLEPLLTEHLEDQFNEILPHVFFIDVTIYVVQLYEKTQQPSSAVARLELHEILAHFEATYAEGDDELQNLLAVSFLENLPRPDEEGGGVRSLLGPELLKQLRRFDEPPA